MDGKDEPNSYLKYLNDSDTPNTYLLGNNEVGLFSVEPIFTEMEATDWPQEGFPLLLTNSLITEDSTEDTQSQGSDKNIVVAQHASLDSRENNLQGSSAENSIDNKILEVQNIIEIQPSKNVQLNASSLKLNNDGLLLQEQNNVQLNEDHMELDNNCLQLNENSSDNKVGVTEDLQLHTKDVGQLKPQEKYILLYGSNEHSGTKIVKLVTRDKTPLPTMGSVLNQENVPVVQTTPPLSRKKTKSVNDLFSTVIANKCKICAFLCEDLKQIKRHIGEKHPEFLFTHNGISSGVSLLLSNAKKKDPQSSEVKKEFIVFVCSECHGVCADKDDLKQHMIQIHNLIMEAKAPATKPKEKTELTKATYQKTTVLSDVNISLVKKQEKAMQKVKCTVSGCLASFPTDELCNTHVKLHIGEKKSHFKCLECEETFHMWRIVRSHMYKEHDLDFGMIVCPMCGGYKSYKAGKILGHMVIHSEEKPFVCQECGKSYKQLVQLKNHEVLHKTPEDMPTWCRVKKCDKCQGFFANSKSLKSHIQAVHERFKPFICNICGHKTSRKSMLELHLRQHTGSKPYKCDYCVYKTGDPNCLRKHMMKHVGATTYQCPYCPYRCIQAGSIKSHLIHKHEGRSGPLCCKHCSYTTINPMFLRSHEKNHDISSTEGARMEETSATETERRTETDLQMDEETQSCFLNTEVQIEETVDKGGITIPAGSEMQLVS